MARLRRWSAEDSAAVKCLIGLGILFSALSYVAYNAVFLRHVRPLGLDAPQERFSEARAIEHVRYLSVEIDGRQEGKPGLDEAAKYITKQLEIVKESAGPGYRIDIDQMSVSGTFNMTFLGHSVSLGYRNHTNILFRISSTESNYSDPSVLVNGHFDSPLGSPGAGDCGSCVASMLELARLIVDSGWIPPRPVIFLFNGAEEIFLLGSHGFMKSHEWASSLGAFINIEASGSGGLDLVCQSGPGSWPSLVYAESALYPMGQSSAQDVFGIIPGDTDYRIFAKDYGNIPGLDIIFVLGGYYYHTSHDTLERLIPGSIQARGDNLFSLVKAFTASPLLRNSRERENQDSIKGFENDRAVYFDYLSSFMIIYSRRISIVLHNLPVLIFFLMPLLFHFRHHGKSSIFLSFVDFLKELLFHVLAIVLGILVPIVFAIIRLCFSTYAMSWYARPYLAYMMFIPCSVLGLLIPRAMWGYFSVISEVSSPQRTSKVPFGQAFWGAFGFYGFINLAYTLLGFGGAFMTFLHAAFMLPAWIIFCLLGKYFGHQSLRSLAGYVIPLIPDVLYSVYFGAFIVQFVIEKMGMGGSPHPFGYFIADIVVAAVIGLVTGLCLGPLLPLVGHWLSRTSVMTLLLQLTVVAMAVSSQLFPYASHAPKRVAFHQTFDTSATGNLLASSYEFSSLDANPLEFLFKYSPDAVKMLEETSGASIQSATDSDPSSWVALYPIPFLFSGSLRLPVQGDDILKHYKYLPRLIRLSSQEFNTGSRKIHVEIELGSLDQIWAVVLNITGPLSGWSFADSILPAPERINGGPPSYICRLTGRSNENWAFWLEASRQEPLRVDLAVLDQFLLEEPKKLQGMFPSWVDVLASSTFLSSYYF